VRRRWPGAGCGVRARRLASTVARSRRTSWRNTARQPDSNRALARLCPVSRWHGEAAPIPVTRERCRLSVGAQTNRPRTRAHRAVANGWASACHAARFRLTASRWVRFPRASPVVASEGVSPVWLCLGRLSQDCRSSKLRKSPDAGCVQTRDYADVAAGVRTIPAAGLAASARRRLAARSGRRARRRRGRRCGRTGGRSLRWVHASSLRATAAG